MSDIPFSDFELQTGDVLLAMAEAFLFSDLQGTIRVWNPGAEAIFGYGATEAIGQSLDLIIPERLRQAHWAGYHKALALGQNQGSRKSRITRALRKDGADLYVDMGFAVVQNRQGQTLGALAIARDATARYLEERSLRQQVAQWSARS